MWLVIAAAIAAADVEQSITVKERAVLVADVSAACPQCDWAVPGREAVMLRLSLDGRYVQHLPLTRSVSAGYRVLLGTVDAGTHRLQVAIDRDRSARDLRADGDATVRIASIDAVGAGDPRYPALAHAPFVYERPNTVGRFSDVPVFMWYEVEPTERGTRYRYTVIFTNEDGGTPVDRLMATWGRPTDIEYVYSVELDRAGRILAHDIQGPEHEILPYRGPLDQQHPSLWVVTDNNMVLDRGTTAVRFAPAPFEFPLRNVSREAVMDANPWLYAVSARELVREGKIVADAPPGHGAIPDTRRYVYLEGCGTVGTNGLTFSVKAGDTWLPSDRGVAEYRIARDGCFRGAVPLPASLTRRDVTAVRIQAHERAGKPSSGPVQLTDINTVFMLDESFVPGPTLLQWHGNATLPPGGTPFELPVK